MLYDKQKQHGFVMVCRTFFCCCHKVPCCMPGDLNLQCGTSLPFDNDTKNSRVVVGAIAYNTTVRCCRPHIKVLKNLGPLKKREIHPTVSWKLLYQELERNFLPHKRKNSALQVTKQDETQNTLLCASILFSVNLKKM